MHKAKWFIPLLMCVCIIGCGPDTIFVRPGLDTPSQHVVNGNQFLERGKIDDAYREFERARELDPNYVSAYIGLGLALGKKGDIDAGMATMALAEKMAGSARELEAVQNGYANLKEMKKKQQERKANE